MRIASGGFSACSRRLSARVTWCPRLMPFGRAPPDSLKRLPARGGFPARLRADARRLYLSRLRLSRQYSFIRAEMAARFMADDAAARVAFCEAACAGRSAATEGAGFVPPAADPAARARIVGEAVSRTTSAPRSRSCDADARHAVGAAPTTGPVPAWSCRVPCRRPGRRPAPGWTTGATSAHRSAGMDEDRLSARRPDRRARAAFCSRCDSSDDNATASSAGSRRRRPWGVRIGVSAVTDPVAMRSDSTAESISCLARRRSVWSAFLRRVAWAQARAARIGSFTSSMIPCLGQCFLLRFAPCRR
jgi:hypothetical protein